MKMRLGNLTLRTSLVTLETSELSLVTIILVKYFEMSEIQFCTSISSLFFLPLIR